MRACMLAVLVAAGLPLTSAAQDILSRPVVYRLGGWIRSVSRKALSTSGLMVQL